MLLRGSSAFGVDLDARLAGEDDSLASFVTSAGFSGPARGDAPLGLAKEPARLLLLSLLHDGGSANNDMVKTLQGWVSQSPFLGGGA